jgi:tetratricopeptide (TPR) repeat protein
VGRFAALLVVCAFFLPARAAAQSGDAVARARTHFEAGRALYNLGNYTDAIREFSAGYQLAPRPPFLINLGQCYRKLGDLEHAREMYVKFLEESPPEDPDRAQVRQVLSDLDAEIARQPAKPKPRGEMMPAAPYPDRPSPGSEPRVTPAPAAAVVVAAPPPEKKPFIKRHWWIIPVSIVAAAGLGLGLGLGLTAASGVNCDAASLGCVYANTPAGQ